MKLEPEHEAMVAGEAGKAMAGAMNTLVEYGKAFGAKKMVPIKSCHLAGTTGIKFFKAYVSILKNFVEERVKCKVLTTVNPRPGYDLHFGNKFVYANQKILSRCAVSCGGIDSRSAGSRICF
jgi:predicted aconitase